MKVNRYIKLIDEMREKDSFDFSLIDMRNSFTSFQNAKIDSLPKQLTYYCRSEVANSIIGDGFIWLTSIRKMNDSSEMHHSTDLLYKKLEHLREESASNNQLTNIFKQSLDSLSLGENENDGLITYEGKIVLALCFSTLYDNAAMWERYANKGKGFAITFDTEKLFIAIKTAGIFIPSSSAYENGITKMCYETKNCQCIELMYSEVMEAYRYANSQDEKDLIRTLLHAQILELLVSHKHPSFDTEQECRIFAKTPLRKTWIGSDHLYVHDVGSQKSVHYKIFLPNQAINQSVEEFWNNLIYKVTAGPLSSETDKEQMKKSMESRNINLNITESECPLQTF